jgi:type IV pilus assembly protein PilV
MRTLQSGVSLLEALISLLVLSVGVLGIISIQANLLMAGQQAQSRMQASLLANRLIGLAAADPANAGCYAVNVTPMPTCASPKAQALAAVWAADALNALPNAARTPPVVNVDGAGVLTVTLQWKRDQESVTHNYITVSRVAP